MKDRKLFIAAAFVLSISSCALIITSAATDQWINAYVWTLNTGNTGRLDYVHYGLYGGIVEFRHTMVAGRHTLHMVCLGSVSACAVTCKTTPEAREQEVSNLGNGYRPASLACDDNADVNLQSMYLGYTPVIPMGIYVTVNLFLYIQLLFAACAALLSLVNLCMNPTKQLFGLRGTALISCTSALMGLLVLMIWAIHYGNSNLQFHMAFAYIAAQNISNAYSSLGYSYWILLPAVLCSIGCTMVAHLRSYLDKNSF